MGSKVVSTSTVRQIGNSLGFIIPKKLVDELGYKVRDFVVVSLDEKGNIIISKEVVDKE